MRPKRHQGSNNNRNHRSGGGRNKYRSNNGGGGNDSQSLARQKKHAMTQKEKYQNMARDAQSSGERVDAEYYYQHVEHYARTLAEIEAKEPKPQLQQERQQSSQQRQDVPLSDDATPSEESASNDNEASDTVVEAKDEPSKPKARTRRAAPRKEKQEEIPLPASVIPEAESVEAVVQ